MVSRFYLHTEGDKPYIAWEMSLFSTPRIVTTYWRVLSISNPYARTWPKDGDELTGSGGDGVFYAGIGVSLRIDPKEEGRQVERDYPCPKTRLRETRYQDGEWQGLSKRDGWVTLHNAKAQGSAT